MRWRSLAVLMVLSACGNGLAGEETPPAREGEDFFFIAPGFQRAGEPKTVSGADTGTIEIVVRDLGEPTRCRIAIVGPDGDFYQPEKNRLSPYAMTGKWPAKGEWGNRADKAPYRYLGHYFYSSGLTKVAVPPGTVRIEVAKGWEYAPVSITTSVVAGQTKEVNVPLRQTALMEEFGYFNGDIHLHFPRTKSSDDDVIFDLLEAEDIRYGMPLGYNEPAGPYAGVMSSMDSPQLLNLGKPSLRKRGACQILSGQEYRSVHYGHLMLYLRDRVVFEDQKFNIDDGLPYGHVAADVIADGGLAIHAHGGYAKGIYADAALGAVSGVELLQFGIYRPIGLVDWYHMLNTGYRFPAFGASDFPACRFLGDCRTYVWAKTSESRLSLPDWLHAGANGQSFISTGPLLLLEVDGRKPGETISYTGSEPRSVSVTARVRCEVTPVQHLDLIVNGEVVKQLEIPAGEGQGKWQELRETLKVSASSWIAARAWSTTPGGQPDAEAHTNPVFVILNNRRPYQQASLDAWVQRIDEQIAIHTKRDFPEKARTLAFFQQARDVLLKIRAQHGWEADVEISALIAAAESAADVARLDITEDELKEYLKPVPPLEPTVAEKSFEVAAGFQMQLVAAEPLVYDPIAAEFDEDGQLYVCEMRDYPYKPAEGKDPIGSVRLLRDTDGDGRFDEAHLFADKLLWAAGVAPWQGGVFVAACPDIWYLKDTDGDHVADVRRKVFTGFGTGNQQAMVNNLRFGLDHWIYGATAGNGGMITKPEDPDFQPIPITGRDFRFHPVTGEFEAITGTVQFGNTFDDWGNRFVCSESNPLRHVVLPDHYLARNPFLAAPGGIHNIAPAPVPIFRTSPVERWRNVRTQRRLVKNERSAASAGASHFVIDAAAGVTIYRGGAYPPEFYGQAFVGDGQNNLVHRRRLIPDGLTFKSERVDENTEIVRTPDIWFRPVNCVNAPDGTLYILDMSREVLESIHIPLDVAKHLDLRSGRDHGRIYRLAPPDFHSPLPPSLSRATIPELIRQLESPHGWYRDTAHRLLFERFPSEGRQPPESGRTQGSDAAGSETLLRQLVRHSQLPQARLHALWSLQGMHALDVDTLMVGLSDEHPGVREQSIKLSEPFLKTTPALLERIAALVDDENPRIRFQTAFSLGEAEGSIAARALSKLARRDDHDEWMRSAILSSATPLATDLFEELLLDREETDPAKKFVTTPNGAALLGQLAQIVGARREPAESQRIYNALAGSAIADNPSLSDPLVIQLGRGMKRGAGPRIDLSVVKEPAREWLKRLEPRAVQTAANAEAAPEQRVAAIEILDCFPPQPHRILLYELLKPATPEAVQIAVIRTLLQDIDTAVAARVLEAWPLFPPEPKRIALESLLSSDLGAQTYLTACIEGKVSAAEVDALRREQLLKHIHPEVQSLAQQAFQNITSPTRQAVIAEYQSALQRHGRVEEGAKIFEKTCAVCHRVGGKGFDIGPSLASAASQPASTLLTHILDPNQYVLPNYVQYLVIDTNGITHAGLLASQTATSITLKKEKGETETLLKGEIDELTSSRKSLMPEGLEKAVSVEAMADLIAFLQEATKKTPGDPNSERDRGTLAGTLIEDGK
ncbi:MAG: PVC-type heme-binding CxxCH protein [Planctomycetaceae bacterium]